MMTLNSMDDSNTSTGAAFRPKESGKAHQCLIYVESGRWSNKFMTKRWSAVNDAAWRDAA